jgi:hypothetical protein
LVDYGAVGSPFGTVRHGEHAHAIGEKVVGYG